jgi:hypothetical protein
MRKALPFLVSPKSEIRAIGTLDSGIIHLEKKGGISPNENPIDLQEAGTRQAQMQLMLQGAIKRLAEEKSITKGEARKQLFAMPVRDAETGEQSAEDVPSLYDYLSPEESALLISLRDDTAAIAIKAATAFIKYRVAYPVQVSGFAKAKAESASVQPLSFPIESGRKIQFGYKKITVRSVAEAGDESLNFEALSDRLEEGAIGYLCGENGKIFFGNPMWTELDTRECLTEDLITRIYNFYQAEAAGLSEEEAFAPEEAEGNENPVLLSSAS